jgi:hypothetical protein
MEIHRLPHSTRAASLQNNDNPGDAKTILSQIGDEYEYWWVPYC